MTAPPETNRADWLVSLMPSDTPDYMLPAWLGCISWALRAPEIVRQFREETGNRWQPSRTVMGEMVDRATGADHAFFEAFIGWANVNVWGPMDLDGPRTDGPDAGLVPPAGGAP